jgi:DMSO/TMAO reductase YedYZ molybdopterin-dependent catalytic subunit
MSQGPKFNADWLRSPPSDDRFDVTRHDADDARRRKPPGQTYAKKFPHLEYAKIPTVDAPQDWTIKVFGEVEHPFEVNILDLFRFPQRRVDQDFHCITGWSLLDTVWHGTPGVELAERARPADSVTTVLVHGLDEFSTCLWVEDFLKGLVAWSYQERPLALHHGFPLRFIAPPHLWQYKSCKWVTGFEFLTEHKLGFWEIRAYSDSAMVWENDRYANPMADEGKPMGQLKAEVLRQWRQEKAATGSEES